MWVTRSISASRVCSRRLLSLLAISLLMALLAVSGPLSQAVSAIDAIWSGTTLSYDGKVYNETTSAPDRPGEPNEYEWRLNTGGPTVASVLYFGDDPANADEATLVEYNVTGSNYTPSKPPQPVTVSRDLTVDNEGTTDNFAGASCDVSGIGWVICPLANWLSEGVDWVYGIVESFLEVQTITTSDSGVYQIWQLVRNIANVCFILVFIAIVYSQLTGLGYSNHNIKDMIPRLVIGAALVNVSFWISALAVDASNLLGYSVQAIFETVRDNITLSPTISGEDFSWAGVTAAILGGGWAAKAGFAAAAGHSGISLSFLLIATLLPAAFAVLVAFIILAARQALIVVLTIISPLAFVAFVLPSTQSLFDKWRKTFTTLLVFFPIFALIFGGSQLAGTAILNSSADAQPNMQLPLVLIGMATMVVPLVITPLLVRFSSGLLGQIANMANSKNRGLVDRAQNWARDNAEVHKGRKLRKRDATREARMDKIRAAEERGEKVPGWKRRHARHRGAALRMELNKLKREHEKALTEETLKNSGEKQWSEQLNRPKAPNRLQSALGIQQTRQQRTASEAVTAHTLQKQAQREKEMFDSSSEEHWSSSENDPNNHAYAHYRRLRTDTATAKGRTEVYEKEMNAQDDQTLKAEIKGSDRLTDSVKRAYSAEQQAKKYEEIVQKAAESSWNRQVQQNDQIQTLVLEAKSAEDQAGLEEQRVKTFVQNVRTKGAEAPDLAATAQTFAEEIKETYTLTDVSKNAEAAAQKIEQTQIAKAYDRDEDLRREAGGIGGQAAANLVFARAKQTIIKNQQEGTDAEKSILTQEDSDEIFGRMDDPNASVEQLAAYAGTIAKRGYHADHIRLLAKASAMYTEADNSGDPDRVAAIKDMIQQISVDQSKIAFGLSDRDRTLLEEGRYNGNIFASTRDRILTNLSPEVLSGMDPDDLNLLGEMHRKGLLSPEQTEKIRHEYDQWQKDPMLKSKIKAKHRNVLDRIVTGDYTSTIDGMSALDDMFGIDEDSF